MLCIFYKPLKGKSLIPYVKLTDKVFIVCTEEQGCLALNDNVELCDFYFST